MKIFYFDKNYFLFIEEFKKVGFKNVEDYIFLKEEIEKIIY